MQQNRLLVGGLSLLAVGILALTGVRAPAQEKQALPQGIPSGPIKRLGKIPTPMERLERQVTELKAQVTAQQTQIEELKQEVASTRAAFGQFTLLDGHPRAHISKAEWDNLPPRSLIRVRPR